MKAQALVGPVMAPGVELVVVVMLSERSPLTEQFETDFTFNDAVVKFNPNVTVILVVPCPLTNVIPVGIVHEYDVALATALIEYTTCVAVPKYWQALLGPVMLAGAAGTTLDTVNDLGALLPQFASAVTLIAPEINELV